MADINDAHAHDIPTEADAVSYRGIVWFVAILVLTVVMSEFVVIGVFKLIDVRWNDTTAVRPPLAAPAGTLPPQPNLLVNEPGNLAQFRAQEDQVLTTYGWVDKNAGVVRLPIERAKALILQRGFAVRQGVAPAPAAAASVKK